MGIISEIWRCSGVVFWTLPTRLLTPWLTCVRELAHPRPVVAPGADARDPLGKDVSQVLRTHRLTQGARRQGRETGPRDMRVLHNGCISAYWTRALTQMLTAFQLIINRFPGRPACSLHTSFGPVSQWLELLPVLLSLTGFLLELRKSPLDFGEGELTHNKHPEHDLHTEGAEPALS